MQINKIHKYHGLTLVELMITLVIAAILLSIAAPSFSDAMRNSKQSVVVNELMGSLKFARSEAIKQASRTTVCARGVNDTCGTDWSEGHITFVDTGPTIGEIEAGEEILRLSDGVETDTAYIYNRARLVNTMAAPAQRNYIRFGPRGTSDWRGSGYFVVCDGDHQASARGINISLSGDPRRARLVDDVLINSFNTEATCETTSGSEGG